MASNMRKYQYLMTQKSHAHAESETDKNPVNLNITKDTWFLCPFSACHAQYQSVKVYFSKSERHIYIFYKTKENNI